MRALLLIFPRGAQNIRAFRRRHRLLLLGAHHQHHVMQTAHDLLGRPQHSHAAGSARRFDMKGGDPAQFSVNLSEKRAQMKLPSVQATGEISDHPGLDVSGIYARLGNGTVGGLENDVANRLAFLLEVTLEVGPSGANDINRLSHNRMPQEANSQAVGAQRDRRAWSRSSFAGCAELCQLLASERETRSKAAHAPRLRHRRRHHQVR